MKFLARRNLFICTILLFLCSSPVFATPVGYTDYTLFMSALPGGTSSVLNFDSPTHWNKTISSGDTLENITFTYNLGTDRYGNDINLGVDIFYNVAFTSPWGALGSTYSGNNYMINNDAWSPPSLSFEPVNAIGMYFITAENLWDYNLGIEVDSSLFFMDGDASITTDFGYNAYFIGIIDDQNTFTQADIFSPFGYFSYTVDDIITATASTVPEPSTMLLFSLGLLGLAEVSRSKDRRSRSGDLT